MLKAIQNYFDSYITPEPEVDIEHQLKLATTALLIEMMLQDDDVAEQEIITIKETIQNTFELTADESQTLFELAEQEQRNSTDYHQFTRLIAKNYTKQQKCQVIENLWRIAYADGHLDRLEEHMLRRISDLIYVAHSDFIRIKHKVLES
ncbi:MAG: TerB family tellurite resistance protein [Gammaproteobacteria bacterium]